MSKPPVMTLYCRACRAATDFDRRWVTDDDQCSNPACQRKGLWSSVPLPDDPTKPYVLSDRDRLFLKAIRVDPDQ